MDDRPQQLPSPTPSAFAHSSPPPIASTSAGGPPLALPTVGTSFPTLEALQLACYTFALHEAPPISFGIHIGKSSAMHLGCTAQGYGSTSCSCKLVAYVSADRTWTVARSEMAHSHDRLLKPGEGDNIRRRMEKRIAKLDDVGELAPSGGKAPSTKPGPWTNLASEPPCPVGTHPSAKELASAIRSKQEEFDGFVPLPTPARGYASSRLLLIDIYAAYAQRGVELYRYSPGTAAAFVRLKCLRGHWRTGCVDTCKVRLALRREDDGRWHFVSEAGAHNHPLGDGDGHPMDVDGEREGDSDELSEPSDDESEAEWDAAQDDARADDEVERQGRMAPEPVEADRLVHQPLSKIRQSVQVLAQGDPLRFPLPTNDVGFPAHGAFRIYTLAAAVQRDFTMYLCTTPGSRTAFKLLCTKAHSRFGADRCTFEMQVVRSEGGPWRCARIVGSHNHPVKLDDANGIITTTALVPQKRALEAPTAARRPPPPAPAPARNLPTPTPPINPFSSKSLAAPRPRPPPPRPSTLAPLPTAAPPRPAPPARIPSHALLPAPQGVKRYGAPSRLPLPGAPPPKITYVPRPNATFPSLRTAFPAAPPPPPAPTFSAPASRAPSPIFADSLPSTRHASLIAPSPAAFEPTLRAFLACCLPTLALHAPLFLHAGLTSTTALANAVLMENDDWTAELAKDVVVDGKVRIKGLSKMLVILFKKGLMKIRKEMKTDVGL